MEYRFFWCIAILLLTGITAALAQTPPHVLAGGGGVSESATTRIQSTIGQPIASDIGHFAGFISDAGVGFWYLIDISPGEVGDVIPELKGGNFLGQNSPNPFNPSTTIEFGIAAAGQVRLGLYNLKGQMLAQLVDRQMPAGRHSLVFRPEELSSGVYFYRLETGSFIETRRLTLLK